tara:strand:+ start:1310 stop:1720 length:411 start_codon:yes stop_codon:yes gene_type:complete
MIIRQFKLLNGDDIIAVLQTKNADNYIIERPVQVVTNMFGQLTFNHWFPLSSQRIFKLYKNRCIQHVPIDSDIESEYTKFIMTSASKQNFEVQDTEQMIKTLMERSKEYTRMMEEEQITDEDYYPLPSEVKDPTIH